jgi:hypothetical protein
LKYEQHYEHEHGIAHHSVFREILLRTQKYQTLIEDIVIIETLLKYDDIIGQAMQTHLSS